MGVNSHTASMFTHARCVVEHILSTNMIVSHLVFVAPLTKVQTLVQAELSNPLKDSLVIWEEELLQDFDKVYLLSSIYDGVRVIDAGSSLDPMECPNNRSAIKHSDKVEEQIVEELTLGRYVCVRDRPTIISPLGCVEKKGSKGKVRLIHDCSQPFGKSLDSYATKTKFVYDTIDKATQLLEEDGYVAKVDLRSAYCSCGIHPDSYHAAGLAWTFSGNDKPDMAAKEICYKKATAAPCGKAKLGGACHSRRMHFPPAHH